MKRMAYIAGIVLCICAMTYSGFRFYRFYAKDKTYSDEFSKLAEQMEYVPSVQSGAVEETAVKENETPPVDEDILPRYRELHRQNSDMTGWIRIEGTSVNYPVMYTPDDPNYYLKRDFDGQYSDYGVPYIGADCNVSPPSDNIIIHGHNIKNGNMFGALADYKNKSFYEAHKIIRFDTLSEPGEYVVLAVFETVADSDGGFAYYDFISAADADEFAAYVSKCKELSLYETDVTAEYGDKLLTLSTCEYFSEDGRLAVVAKKITD